MFKVEKIGLEARKLEVEKIGLKLGRVKIRPLRIHRAGYLHAYVFLDYGTRSEKLFHCGASSKDGGNKITTIMQVECPEMYHPIVEEMRKVSAKGARISNRT